jgi:hypothetical protein
MAENQDTFAGQIGPACPACGEPSECQGDGEDFVCPVCGIWLGCGCAECLVKVAAARALEGK